MRWSLFFTLQGLIIAAILGVVYIHQDRVVMLKKPPASLAQWYKPANKRQVWLHTMFKLRREMQAVDMYAKAGDGENLQKWADKLNADYLKIAKMVPEWQPRVDGEALAQLQASVGQRDFAKVSADVAKLNTSCKSCHADFRAVTAAMYRAPDFSNVKVEGAETLTTHMQSLTHQVNRIKIAFVDGRDDAALAAYAELSDGMKALGGTCESCHKGETQPYPNASITAAMTTLEQSLTSGSLQDKGRALGTVAVLACAQCHGTHRLSFDARKLLTQNPNWRDLLKHSF